MYVTNISARLPPSVTNATASGLTGDGIVVNGEEVTVAVNVTDGESDIRNVTANASAFGAGTIQLTDADGDGRYTGTFTVDTSESAPTDSSYRIPIRATDEAGTTNDSVAAGPLTLEDLDTTVSLSPADRQLTPGDTTTIDIVVSNVSNGIGAWQLTINQTDSDVVSIVDVTLSGSPGQQTVSIGGDGASLYADAALVDTNDTGPVTIATVTVSGEANGSSLLELDVASLGTEAGFGYDVTDTRNATLDVTEQIPPDVTAAIAEGADGDGVVVDGETVTVAANVTDTGSGVRRVVANATAFGAGSVAMNDSDGDGRYTATFAVNASAAAQPGTTYEIPITATDNAGNTNATVTVGPLEFDVNTQVRLAPTSREITTYGTTTFDVVVSNVTDGIGAWKLSVNLSDSSVSQITDVTLYGAPDQRTISIAADNGSVFVEAAGANTTDIGTVTVATVTVAGDTVGTSALDLEVTRLETEAGSEYGVSATVGANLTVETEQTPPQVSTATATGIGDGEVVVDGETVTVAVNVSDDQSGVGSVTANASAFGAGSVTLTDADGDGRYNGTFTVDESAAATPGNTYEIPITATDNAGNTNATVAAGPLALASLDTAVSVVPATRNVTAGNTTTVEIVLADATEGVGAWTFTLTASGGDAVEIRNVTLSGTPERKTVSIASDNDSVTVEATGADTVDRGAVTVATVTLAGDAIGRSELAVDVASVETETGFAYNVTSTSSTRVRVSPPAVRPVYAGPPTDTDDDGLLEDVNGDGNFTIVDVQAFYASRNRPAVQSYAGKYNYNGFGDVDIVDVQRLYFELQQGERPAEPE